MEERNSNTPLHWATTRKYRKKKHHGSRELNMWLFGQISILEWGLTHSSSHNMLVELFKPTLQMSSLLIRAWDSMELHESPCYCPILGFSSACGLAHRMAPWHPCLAWGSRGWHCAAGTQRWAANCWHLQGKRNINKIIWSLKQDCPGEGPQEGCHSGWHCSSQDKRMSCCFVWKAGNLNGPTMSCVPKSGLSTSSQSQILCFPSSETETLAVSKWLKSKPTSCLPFISRNQALLEGV